MLKQILAAAGGKALNTMLGIDGIQTLVAESITKLNAHWQTAVITINTTTTIVAVRPQESIMLTDLIITSSKKVAGLDITAQFYDGTNTVVMMGVEGATAPVNFGHAFAGGLRGWKDADFQIVTDVTAGNVTVMVGYVRISPKFTLDYSVWDAER